MQEWLSQIRQYLQSGKPSEDWEISLVYRGRNTLYRLTRGSEDYVVKVFGRLSLWRRAYYSYLGQTKARRSYEYAKRLSSLGIRTPEPIGYQEERTSLGFLGASYYACRYESVEPHIHAQMNGWACSEGFMEALAQYIAHLHQLGIAHEDLSPGNLPYRLDEDGRPHFFLVDLNRMSFLDHPLPPKEAYHNLCRLPLCLSVGNQLSRLYAQARGWDAEEVRRGVTEVSDQFFRRRNFKLSYRYASHILGEGGLVFLLRYLRYRFCRWVRELRGKSPSPREEAFYHRYLMLGDIRRAVKRRFGYH